MIPDAMYMLTALTQKAVLSVPATRDSQEMDLTALVRVMTTSSIVHVNKVLS